MDTEAVARARAGDDAAWYDIVRAHQEAVFRFAYLALGDAHEAEDIGQEVFVRAFRALDTFDTSRPLRPWLLSITSNLCSNRRRSVGRYFAALKRAYFTQETSTALGEHTAEEWEAHTLWKAVQRLKRHEQEVVYLRFFLELSEAEMAQALNIAPGTVKSRLHRALQRLRSVVDREFPALREERQT